MKDLLGLVIVISLPILLLVSVAVGADQQEAIVESLKLIARM